MIKKIISFSFILSITIAFAQHESYYNDISSDLQLTGNALKEVLATKIINTHTVSLDYSPDIWNASKITDLNPTNSSEVLLIYGWENGTDGDVTNDKERGVNENGGNVGDWNREHTFANSLGDPDLDASGDNGPPYSDAHNLRPSDVQRNSSRNNKKFATGTGIQSGAVTNGWYPGDEWRGDVARIAMYMYLRYGDQCKPTFVGVGNSDDTFDDMIDLFLEWNVADPVSDLEKQRNPYHEDTTNNAFAQGNRNPFIDNPRLATRIWGGPEAEDIWGIYSVADAVAPTTPTNIVISNETTSSLDVTWTASTDNIAVTSYDIYLDGTIKTAVTTNSTTITGLNSNTTYSISIIAKDAANNSSAESIAQNGTTLTDSEAPTIPTNVIVSNETDTTFKVSWSASTDNTAVTSYDVYLDGSLHGNTTITEYTATGLNSVTTYLVTVIAKDAVNNMSNQSASVNGITTDGSGSSANELFFSEYVEGSSNNKALEIANVTDTPIDLSIYSIKRNGNGGATWSSPLNLSGILQANNVYVIVNGDAENSSSSSDPNVAIAGDFLIAQADFIQPNTPATNNGSPINFNGNDPVGLFKNDILIDIIGVFNGGSANFAKDKTLRRISSVVNPNTTYTISEWEELPNNTVDNIGVVNSGVLNINSFNNTKFIIYPNPVKNGKIYFNNTATIEVKVHNILGKIILQKQIETNNDYLDVSSINQGVYLVKIKSGNKTTTKKMVIK